MGCPSEQQLQTRGGGDTALVCIRRVIKLEKPEFPLEFYYMREARRRVVAAFRGGRIPIDVVSS